MNTFKREVLHIDRRAAIRLGGVALLGLTLLGNACRPSSASAPAPHGTREIPIDVSCGDLDLQGVYYHAEDGSKVVAYGFAPWSHKPGDPTSGEAIATVPLNATALRIDIGCGKEHEGPDKGKWGINSHQRAINIRSGSMVVAVCGFTPNDLPSDTHAGTVDLADACQVTVKPELASAA